MLIVVKLKTREYWWAFRLKFGTALLNAAYKAYPPLKAKGGFQSTGRGWYKR